MDMPDDSFLAEVVNRWRAQSHNPDGLGYSVEAAPEVVAALAGNVQQAHIAQVYAPQPAPAQPTLRRQPIIATPGFGQTAPAAQQPQTSPATPAAQHQSLASLIRQFRN